MSSPEEITLLTLNCWGLLHLSALRTPRLLEIGRQLASHSPTPHIVCLQECWTQADFAAIHAETASILPHAKFYHSGAFGGGLAILSKWPIEESSMIPYVLNGRPTAFWRGDWYVGKGIAHAVVRYGHGRDEVMDVYNTHTHAPYESGPGDTYLCHRTSQSWQLAKHLLSSHHKGRLAVALGDFNMLPLSLEHRILTAAAPVRDTWRVLHPDSSVGPHHHPSEQSRGLPCPSAAFNLSENGATSDGRYNTWRWTKARQKELIRSECPVDGETDCPLGKRLDYIFASTASSPSWSSRPRTSSSSASSTKTTASSSHPTSSGWVVSSTAVTMTGRHPTLNCSLSDHFGVVTTLKHHHTNCNTSSPAATSHDPLNKDKAEREGPDFDAQLRFAENWDVQGLSGSEHDEILDMISWYRRREQWEQTWRGYHFYVSLLIWIGCLVATWFSPRNFVSFILMLVSSLALASGVVNGLIALLFFSWELRGLKEFEWEVRNSKARSTEEHT